MKMWEREKKEINKWQSVLLTRIGILIMFIGVAVLFIELFLKPGTQYALGVITIGAGIAGVSDGLATYETKIGDK